MLHDSHYSSNTVTNLIFFEILEWQEFEIEKIRKSDDLCLFRITDLEDQVFTANQSDINIYLIQKKISDVLTAMIKKTAAKTDAKSKLKSKLKSNSESTDSDRNDNNNKIKIYLQDNLNMTSTFETSQCQWHNLIIQRFMIRNKNQRIQIFFILWSL